MACECEMLCECARCREKGCECITTPTVTERQAVERERQAFTCGAGWYAATPATFNVFALESAARQRAATLYSLPLVRRLRTFIAHAVHWEYRWNPDRNAWESRSTVSPGDWYRAGSVYPEYCEALVDLKANPWEDVPA